MHLPIEVADYVDFYASEHHATNVGQIFRPDAEPLTPNWKHLPIGYHGRAGTVVVSGTDVVRPQRPAQGARPTRRRPSARAASSTSRPRSASSSADRTGSATAVGVDDADDHVFGVVLLNDWSARDIQAWEYVPLGPFLGKSFATSDLRLGRAAGRARRRPGRRCPARTRSRCPTCAVRRRGLRARPALSRSSSTARWSRGPPYRDDVLVARPDAGPPDRQRRQPAHRRPVRVGHGLRRRTRDQRGSLLELTWNGTEPITLADGTQRGVPRGRRHGGAARHWAPGPTADGSGSARSAGRDPAR